MNYVVTIESTFLVVFVATLIVLGLIDMTRGCVRFVLKMIQIKRRSGLWDPLGESATLDDDDHSLTEETIPFPRTVFETDEKEIAFVNNMTRLGVVCPRRHTPRSPSISSPSKPVEGVDDKPRAEVDGEQDDEAG